MYTIKVISNSELEETFPRAREEYFAFTLNHCLSEHCTFFTCKDIALDEGEAFEVFLYSNELSNIYLFTDNSNHWLATCLISTDIVFSKLYSFKNDLKKKEVKKINDNQSEATLDYMLSKLTKEQYDSFPETVRMKILKIKLGE